MGPKRRSGLIRTVTKPWGRTGGNGREWFGDRRLPDKCGCGPHCGDVQAWKLKRGLGKEQEEKWSVKSEDVTPMEDLFVPFNHVEVARQEVSFEEKCTQKGSCFINEPDSILEF